MLKFLTCFDNKEFQPVITHTQVENIQNIIDSIRWGKLNKKGVFEMSDVINDPNFKF